MSERSGHAAVRFGLAATICAMVALFGVSVVIALNPDIDIGRHSAGGRTCDYLGYSTVGDPQPSSTLSYTQITTASCSNIYAELYARSYRCDFTFEFVYSGWVASPLNGIVQFPTSPANDRCYASGLNHRISITGPDVSTNIPTFAP
jgi:hypothetical protein